MRSAKASRRRRSSPDFGRTIVAAPRPQSAASLFLWAKRASTRVGAAPNARRAYDPRQIDASRPDLGTSMPDPAYQRVMVKLSGEVLGGKAGIGLDQPTLQPSPPISWRRASSASTVGVVVGGGNFMRGATVSGGGLARETGDAMGMLATVINALALEAADYRRWRHRAHAVGDRDAAGVRKLFAPARAPATRRRPCRDLRRRHRKSLFHHRHDRRAARRRDGLRRRAQGHQRRWRLQRRPETDPKATRFDKLSHGDAIARDLKVMDATAFALARENRMPIIVFSILEAGAIAAVLRGKARATTVSGD